MATTNMKSNDFLESNSRALVKSYDFSRDGFQVFEEINSGSFARVYRGCNSKREQLAVKIMDLTKTTTNFRHRLLPMELFALRKLIHPYIIKLLDIYYCKFKIYIFMELADDGNLIEYILKYGAVEETKARIWFAQVCSAVNYMQNSCLLAHRDLKCDNVLLHMDVAKLTDFSLVCQVEHTTVQIVLPESEARNNALALNLPINKKILPPAIATRQVQKLATTFCGSPAYVAPEILLSRPYDPFIADCWSLGVILYVMLNNALPFDDTDLPTMIANQLRNRWSFNNRVQPFPSLGSRELIRSILQPRPAHRYDIEKIINHPWLKATMREVEAVLEAQEQRQQTQQQVKVTTTLPIRAEYQSGVPQSPSSAKNIQLTSDTTQQQARSNRKYAAAEVAHPDNSVPPTAERQQQPKKSDASIKPKTPIQGHSRKISEPYKSLSNLRKTNHQQKQSMKSPASTTATSAAKMSLPIKNQQYVHKPKVSTNKVVDRSPDDKSLRNYRTKLKTPNSKQPISNASTPNSKMQLPTSTTTNIPVSPQRSKANINLINILKSRNSNQAASPSGATSTASEGLINNPPNEKK